MAFKRSCPLVHPSAATRANPSTSSNGSISSGIDFPSNGDAVGQTQIRFTGSVRPSFSGTLFWKSRRRDQDSYCTDWFFGPTNGDLPAAGNTFLGCHPYPVGGAGGNPHNFEIATNFSDFIVDDNANSTLVEYGRWYSHACTISGATAKFYWDLGTANTRVITVVNPAGNFAEDPAAPGFVIGDASWAENAERASGVLRGWQIYPGIVLSLADIATMHAKEDNATVLAAAAILGIDDELHYLNMNPTPDDIADHSGNGNSPSWVSAAHGTIWTP